MGIYGGYNWVFPLVIDYTFLEKPWYVEFSP